MMTFSIHTSTMHMYIPNMLAHTTHSYTTASSPVISLFAHLDRLKGAAHHLVHGEGPRGSVSVAALKQFHHRGVRRALPGHTVGCERRNG